MPTRLRRPETVERNREAVLAAARRVFIDKRSAGATLEAIAEEAGFSKGVMYSQFEGKADLFLALLECRMHGRTQQNERIVAEQAGIGRIASNPYGSCCGGPGWCPGQLEPGVTNC